MKPLSHLLVVFIMFAAPVVFSQSKTVEACSMTADQSIGLQYAAKPDKSAEYAEGKDSLKAFLRKHALLIRAEGVNTCDASKAEIDLVVKKDGSVGYVKLVKPAGCGALQRYIDEMFSRMPRWKPALCNGKPVNSRESLSMSLKAK